MATIDQQYDAAIALKNQGNLQGAYDQLSQIVAEVPTHTLSHSAMAVLAHRLGKLDEAIAHAVKVTELEPNEAFSFTQLSVICQRCGRIPEAEEAMAKARMIQGGGH